MARIMVVHERDPSFAIEIVNPDPAEDAHDGSCPRCPWTASEAGTRHVNMTEATHATIVHLDIDHPEV